MSAMRRRDAGQIEATAEHRRREDAAPRLRDEIEHLESLRFHFEDLRPEGQTPAIAYTRPIVVATAPAHFEVRCMDARCNGRHDLSQPVLHALRQSKTFFAGQSPCGGMIGDMACDHTLAYKCEATYAE